MRSCSITEDKKTPVRSGDGKKSFKGNVTHERLTNQKWGGKGAEKPGEFGPKNPPVIGPCFPNKRKGLEPAGKNEERISRGGGGVLEKKAAP